MLIGLPSAALPQLYQDALYVARNLCVKYLWIDSLCIIQSGDESTDWRREAALMSDVYSNSFCNISALDAPDVSSSMFSTRNSESLYPEVTQLTINGQHAPYLLSHHQFWKIEVSRALLNSRAWVLQERLLSRRILHFTGRQLLWECRRKEAAEIYPDGLPPESFDTGFKNLSVDRYSSANNNEAARYMLWYRIVEKYTACNLTFANDKLIALSGVAKSLRPILQDEYVSGMWLRYLACEMLWSANEYSERQSLEPNSYLAPSWSWASVTGTVQPGRPDIDAADILITVISFGLEYATEDNTGLVKSGWIHLRGTLKPIALVEPELRTASNMKSWSIVINGERFNKFGDRERQDLQLQVMLDSFHHDFNEENAKGALYCMPGRVRRIEGGSLYLLLLEVIDREKGTFRRIGLARGYGADLQIKILTRSPQESQFPCKAYTEAGHLVCII